MSLNASRRGEKDIFFKETCLRIQDTGGALSRVSIIPFTMVSIADTHFTARRASFKERAEGAAAAAGSWSEACRGRGRSRGITRDLIGFIRGCGGESCLRFQGEGRERGRK